MKNVKKFLRETKSGGMLGYKRRGQLKLALFAIPLLLFVFALPLILAPTESAVATIAMAAPIGFSFISKAKTEEELSDEEKETLGTIQKALAEGIEQYRKGVITSDELNKALSLMKKEIADEIETQEATKKRDKKIKEATDLIEEVRKVVTELAGEVEKQKKKSKGFSFGKDNDFFKSLRESFSSEKFKSFAGNNTSTNSGEFELKSFNKGLIRKATVSFENNYSGNVLPTYQSDVVVTETPLQRLNIRDFMTVIDASEEDFTSYAFARIYDIDRAAAARSENGELPEGSFKVKEVVCETHRIGWHLSISKRMLKKLRVLENRIMTLLPSGMARQENFQILYGDSRDSNFVGIQQLCPNESILNSLVYEEAAPGKVKSIEKYDNGNMTKVNFVQGYSKLQTGMKVKFTGFANSALNASLELLVYNDESIIVPVTYVAESETTIQANVKFEISNVWGNLVVDANMGDAIQVVVSNLNFDQYMPNLIVMNPIDYCSLCSMKDRNGRKLVSDYIQVNNGIPYFGGIIPIAQLDCISRGKFLTGDFMKGCELIDTQRGFMEFAEDVKTKLTNQVESIISEEVIFAVTVPDSFMYADFDEVINIINAASTLTTNVNIVGPLNTTNNAVMMEAI